MSEPGLSNGVIILAIAIVVGCFAVLWPKIFSPMLFGEPVINTKPIDEGEFTLNFFNFLFLQSALIFIVTFLFHGFLRGNSQFLLFLHLLPSNASKSFDRTSIVSSIVLEEHDPCFLLIVNIINRFYSLLLKLFPFFPLLLRISHLTVNTRAALNHTELPYLYIMTFKLIS